MRIYFFASKSKEQKFHKRYEKIYNSLRKSGCLVATNLQDNKNFFDKKEMTEIEKSGQMPLEKIDALIIEGSTPSSEIGYLVAFALTHKKAILYFLEEGMRIDQNLKQLEKDQNITKYLHINHYTDKTIYSQLYDFLNHVNKRGIIREYPSLKFTLRITPTLERYLDWKSKKLKITKADFLRNVIEKKVIEKDEGWGG